MASAGFTVIDDVVDVLVMSLMLVAVTLTVVVVVPDAVSMVEGALPVALIGLTAPAPVVVKVAPELLLSLVTAATRASV
jgi:hypothetical protein